MTKIIIGAIGVAVLLLVIVVLPQLRSPETSPQTNLPRGAESDTAAEEVTALSNEIAVLRKQMEDERQANQNQITSLQQLIDTLEETIALSAQPGAWEDELATAFESISERLEAVEQRPLAVPSPQTEAYEVQPSAPADTVWIKPLIAPPKSAIASTADAAAQPPSGTGPRLTVPASSVVFTQSLTALVGRIPVGGRIENPWRFKLLSTAQNFTSKYHHVPDLEGVIWTGVAHGDYTLSCVSGTIDTITYVFRDGTVHTQRSASNADDITQGLGWISDEFGNPCVPGALKTNAPQFMRRSILASTASGLARGYADAQTTRTRDEFGERTTTTVTGDVTDYALATAASDAVTAAERWMAQRLDQSFDAIYVAAGQRVAVHIEQQIELDYNALGRQIDHSVPRHTQTALKDDSIGGLD